MTTKVTIEAHCNSETTEVVVSTSGETDVVLQDGEKHEGYVYDERVIAVAERAKQG